METTYTNVKEFFIQIVDMMDSRSVQARSMAMVSLCNFLSKGKGKEKINVDQLSVLLPKFLRFLPTDKSQAMNEAETYLAGFPCDARLCLLADSCCRRHCRHRVQPVQQQRHPQAVLRHGLFGQSRRANISKRRLQLAACDWRAVEPCSRQ